MPRSPIYKEQFNTAEVGEILSRNKYWVFAWEVPSATSFRHPAIKKRFERIAGQDGIKITCLGNDKDYSKRGLNPRAELRVENYHVPITVDCYAKISMRSCQTPSGFEFFQIMTNGPGSYPVIQLEIRKGRFGVRYNTFKALVPHPLFAEHQRRIEWEIEFRLHNVDGFFKVYADKKLVWSHSGSTLYNNSTTAWTQFGVYKNAGTQQNQSIEVYEFEIGKS